MTVLFRIKRFVFNEKETKLDSNIKNRKNSDKERKKEYNEI